MQNLMDVAGELERRDLTRGGIVSQNLILSSSTRVDGDATFNGTVNLNGDVNHTGSNTFTKDVSISGGLTVSTQIVSGDSAGALILDRGGSGIVYAESADNVAQASGTIGVMMVSSAEDTAKLMWTSTTTAPVLWISPPGVLLEACVPSTVCKVGISGIFRVQTNDGPNAGEGVKLSATRGMVSRTTSPTSDGVITVITTNPPTALTGARPLWIKLR